MIGTGLNITAITNNLNDCLLSDEEFQLKPSMWSRFYDPLPPWPIQPGMWRKSIIPNNGVKLNIPDDIELEINLITLETPLGSSPTTCQVFLSDKFTDNLLCTLRSTICDQVTVNQRLHGNGLELSTRVHKEGNESKGEGETYHEISVIHLFGYAGILEDNQDEEGNEEDIQTKH